jgi:hypothetical protein
MLTRNLLPCCVVTRPLYLSDPTSFEALIDTAEDAQLMPLLRERVGNAKGDFTIVDIDAV